MAAHLPSRGSLLCRRTTTSSPSLLLSSSASSSRTSTSHTATSRPTPFSTTQLRHATLVPRPRRPYHFTQLVQLSDGSTYTVRTTSPVPLHRSTKDTRNHVLWQPSEKSLRNVEVDEAGKLAAFRERFGRGWDAAEAEEVEDTSTRAGKKAAAAKAAAAEAEAATEAAKPKAAAAEDPFDSLADLISGYAAQSEVPRGGGLSAKDQAKKDKASKKKK
ncbi:uncharacterized protein E0L32_009796 [Thyridium curvatum]|uniref:Ribosomal protein bL31m N-terminal domain-containing protein n=1 Tax=Thyridium curvatum TaxID=1093900 RepID=A0A507AQG3_9PEZI|nr:uncharacterized protein E0L32_009796 [Thyridium curvatum]TPX08734.1 hypothetical protein E0L32_009796 [Thyridium curvatum]